MSNPETELTRGLREAIRSLGMPCERVHSGKVKVKRGWMQLASVGTPDLWSPLCWIECKMPGEKPTPEQLAWHATAERWGCRVEVVQSVEQGARRIRELLKAREFEQQMGW